MEPALGYPNQKRSASVGRSTARPSSSTMERSQNSSRNLNVGRGSFASGSWVSAGGGGSPRPDGGKKSATDRYALVGSRAAAELVPADLGLVAFSFAAVSTVRSLNSSACCVLLRAPCRRVQRAINAKREMEAREERELEQRRL
jgi:hypothetical protein